MNYKYILGALAALFIVIVFKFLLGQCLNKSKEGCKAKTILKQIGIMVCRMLIFVLSIDYFSTDILKKWLDKKEMQSKSSETQQKPTDKENTKYELRKKAIKYSNTINLILSLFFTVVSFCIAKFCTNKAVCDITFGFVGYRLLSRTIEINIAFVKDIISNNFKTDLTINNRTSLAIKSLCEEILLFASVYVFFLSGDILISLTGGLYSICLDIFNAKVNDLQNVFQFVTVYQKVCSVVLISLCIVNYFARWDKEEK